MLPQKRFFTMKFTILSGEKPLQMHSKGKRCVYDPSFATNVKSQFVAYNPWSSQYSDAMFVSTHNYHQSSEDDDEEEPDTNPLLMTDSRSSGVDSQKYSRNTTNFVNGTLDHGYHSMETLNNDSAKLCSSWLKNDNGNQKLTNNNQTTGEVLWHDSAWSAPQKSGSNLKTNPPRDSWFNLKGYNPWSSNDPVKSHLYVNELDSGIEDSFDSVWNKTRNVLMMDNGQSKTAYKHLNDNKSRPLVKTYQFNEVKHDNSGKKEEIQPANNLQEKQSAVQLANGDAKHSPLSPPPPSGDADVNLVSRNFNNFSVCSNKQRDILRLLQEKRRTGEANIVQPRNEPKILNTGKKYLRSSSTNRHNSLLTRPHYGSLGIADGLVLEKVRYDPNWRRQNVLCSSEDSVKHFYPEVKVKGPLSVPVEPSTRHIVEEPSPTTTTATDDITIAKKPSESPTENTAPSVTEIEKLSDAPKSEAGSADELLGDIESTMPTIDWVAMEAHLVRAAQEDLWSARRRSDREEIRRRLALGPDADEFYLCDDQRFQKKPNLTTRLQSGMNLQICFMNETASDSDNDEHATETPPQETKSLLPRSSSPNNNSNGTTTSPKECGKASPPLLCTSSSQVSQEKCQRPSFFFAKQRSWRLRTRHKHESPSDAKEQITKVEDFYTRQTRLQAEARLALSQAKEMARMQMEVERQKSKKSPISDIVGLSFEDRDEFPLSRQTLTTMNLAQLQVVANDLHTQIEKLNDDLVRLLLNRDDLHMEQDSMLVDIEDLTRYLGAKDPGMNNLNIKNFSPN